MGNWREVSNPNSNTKVDATKKNWRDAVGAEKTDIESIKVKPYSVTAPVIDMPTSSTASYSARKALNNSSVTEGVAPRIDSVSASTMPNSNVAYWEKGMPRTAENQNKKTSETPKQVLGAITDIGASVIKGFLNETGNFPKTTGQVLEGVSNLANKNALTKAASTLIPAPFQPLVNNGQAINQSLLKPTGEAIRNTGDKFNRQNENNSALWNNTLSTAESFGRMGADIPMSLASGLPTPAIMGMTNADETYNENIAKGMDSKEALMRAAVSGAIEGGSEYALGGETVSKVIKGQWKELLAKGGKEAAEEAMKKTLGHKAWDFVKNEILAEAGQEAGTEVLHDVADTVLNGAYNGQWNDGRTLKEDVSNALWAGYGGGLIGIVGGGANSTVKTILNAPGLQAEVVAQTAEGTIIQTETGEQMPVRNAFLQNAEVQEVNVNPAQDASPEMERQLTDDEKINNAIQEIDAVKADHEAGKIKTKDYLAKLADIDSRLYEEPSTTSQEALQQEKQVSLPNTRQTQNKGITEALMSENGQAVVDKIKNDMKSQGIDANFEVIKGSTAFHKDIKKLAKGLGVEVVFYKGDKVPNGFISNSVKNTIFIHSNGQRNDMVATTGHEFLHHVKKTYAKEYGELLNFAKTYFTEESRKSFLNTYSNVPGLQADLAANEDSLLEEMLADEMGNNFVDKNFWQRVYEHSKELFEKLVEAAGKILKSVSGEKYDTYVAQETADTLSKRFENVIAEVRKQVAEGKVDTKARIEDSERVQLKNSVREKEESEKDKLIKVAKKEFGTTNDYREAGYLLDDGTMLDFSEKNDGGEPGVRTRDHREIETVFNSEASNRTENLYNFMKETNSIRLSNDDNYISIELYGDSPLTPRQVTAIKRMAARKEQVIIEFVKSPKNSETYLYEAFDYPTAAQISKTLDKIQDIKTPVKGKKASEYFSAAEETFKNSESKKNSLKLSTREKEINPLEEPDIDPYNDESDEFEQQIERRRNFIAEKIKENKAIEFSKGNYSMIISPSTKGEVYQATTFYDGKPLSDHNYKDIKELAKRIEEDGFKTIKNVVSNDTQFSTRSKEFKQWFGDSKVVDENGEPLKMYHGSGNAIFTKFDKQYTDIKSLYGPGFYFTNNPEIASSYTISGNAEGFDGTANAKGVLPVYLKIENPIDVDNYALSDEEIFLLGLEELGYIARKNKEKRITLNKNSTLKYGVTLGDLYVVKRHMNFETSFDELRERLQDMGFDGITHTAGNYAGNGGLMHKVWIAFEPTQIKSATGNNGNYDSSNPDIRYSTRSKEFKTWFGDSKVKDENGEPKIMYHGTSSTEDFNEFLTFNDSEPGAHFGTAEAANEFGNRVYPVYLSIQNPLEVDDIFSSATSLYRGLKEMIFNGDLPKNEAWNKINQLQEENRQILKKSGRYGARESNKNLIKSMVDYVKSLGYDGFKYQNEVEDEGNISWVVFEPNQVKSAIGNNGNYDANNPDIRESVRQKERQHYSKQYNNSEAMDEEVYKRISDEAKFIDERMSIKSVAEEADKRVKANPKKYIDKIRDSESFGSPEDVAEAEYALLTVQQAAREFDKQGEKAKAEQQWNIAASIASKIITHFSTASRTLNMGKLWRMLDPQGVVRIASKMLDKETTPEQKKKLRTEAGELIKAISKLDEEGLSKIKEALGFDKDAEVTVQEVLDEAEYSRDSSFDEVDERVKEVAELFDTIEARNAKKIADKVKNSIKSVLEGIDFGIKFMARGLELNSSESINDKITRLTEEYYSKPLSERGNLAKILAKELNITMAQADMVAKRINDTMKEVTREEKLKALKGKETSEGKKTAIEKWLTPKIRKSPEVKSWIDRIVELSESGSLTKEDLLPLIAAKYDFKVMTPEISRNLEDLAKNIQGLESGTDEYNRAVNSLNDYMNSIIKHDIFEHLNTIENLAMLSGTKSMMRNVIGNAGRLISYDVEKFGSALLDMAKATVSKNKTRTVLMPNIKEQIKGIGQGYYKELVDAITNTDSRSTEDTREFARYIKYKNKPMSIFQRYVKVLMTDRPFTQAMVNEIVTEAEKLAKKNKVEFDISEARQIAEEEAARTFFNGDDKVIDAVLNIRRIANGGKSWGLGSIVLKFAKVPYNVSKFAVEREYHLASMKILYKAVSTGYGAVKGEDKGYLKDSNFDSKAFIQDISKVASGALVMHLGTLLFTLGMIRVRPDDDDKDKKLLGLEKLVGFNKYQLNLSAIRRYFVEGQATKEPQEGDLLATLDWFAPLSILMIAGIKSQMEHEKKAVQPGERELAWYRKIWDYAVANPAAGIGEGLMEQVNTVLEMPFLQSLNKFKYAENWQDGLMDMLKDIPARFVPAPVKYVKEAVDNTQRETYTDEATGVGEAINKVKVKLPGVSKNMEPKIDMLGKELELYQNAKNNFLNIAINPAISTRYQTTPEAKKLLDVYQRFGIKTHIPTPVDKKFIAKKSEYKSLEKDEPIVLTASEYRYYQQEYGLGVKKLLENFNVYDDPSYKVPQEKAANKLNDKYTELKQEIQRKILEKRGIK